MENLLFIFAELRQNQEDPALLRSTGRVQFDRDQGKPEKPRFSGSYRVSDIFDFFTHQLRRIRRSGKEAK